MREPQQIYEVTVRPDMDGKMKDVDNGLDSIDEIMRDADTIETKKVGGGLAYMLGQ